MGGVVGWGAAGAMIVADGETTGCTGTAEDGAGTAETCWLLVTMGGKGAGMTGASLRETLPDSHAHNRASTETSGFHSILARQSRTDRNAKARDGVVPRGLTRGWCPEHGGASKTGHGQESWPERQVPCQRSLPPAPAARLAAAVC